MTSMSQPNDPPPNPHVQVPVLMVRAKRALEEGRAAEAVELMRQAKTLAPFRNDVRDLMVAALQARAEAAQSGPQPLRIHTRGPLFADLAAMAEPPPEIEMIQLNRPEPVELEGSGIDAGADFSDWSEAPSDDRRADADRAHAPAVYRNAGSDYAPAHIPARDSGSDAIFEAADFERDLRRDDADHAHPAHAHPAHIDADDADAEAWEEVRRIPVAAAAPDLFDAPAPAEPRGSLAGERSEAEPRGERESHRTSGHGGVGRFERPSRSGEPRRPAAAETKSEPDNDSPDRLVSSTVPAPAALGAAMWPPERALGGRRAGSGPERALSARPGRGRARMALAAAALLGFVSLAGAAFFAFSGRNPGAGVAAPSLDDLGKMKQDRERRDLINAADQYLKQSKFALAIEQLEMLGPGVEKEKRLADAYAHQAASYYKSRHHDDARKFYELALRHDPDNSDYSFEIGWMHYYMGRESQDKDRDKAKGRFAEAERFFTDALRMNENNTRALYGLAKVEIARSNRNGAAEYYKRLLRVNPDTREGKEARDSLSEWRVIP